MNSRSKGQRGEREWIKFLLARFPEFTGLIKRGLQSRGGGAEVPDVEGFPEYHWEVKRVERLNVWEAQAQAVRDAPDGKIPALAYRRNRGEWWVSFPAAHALELVALWLRRRS